VEEHDGVKETAAGSTSDKAHSREASDAKDERESSDKAPVKWAKWMLAVAGAIVTIGGAVAVISQTTHWLGNLNSGTPAPQLTVSPNLGISFHQYGQSDPMSADDHGTVTVTLKSEPFELWFPTLTSDESLEVCAATGTWVFENAAETGKKNVVTCLSPGTGGAQDVIPGGDLFLTASDDPKSTSINKERTQPATQGYEEYNVSRFASGPRRIYLVVYRSSDDPQSVENRFTQQRIEDFILNIG
jgi:hypothetical protein